MKTFTYVAAIALLTAGTAFAQSSSSDSSSMQQNTPTQSQSMSHQDMNSGAMNNGSINKGSSMDKSSSMNGSRDLNSQAAATPKAKPHHVARIDRRDRGDNSRENQITAQLNQQQVAQGGMQGGAMGASSGMNSSGMNARGSTSFDNGSPQQAQAGGANCTPDRPDCGTARQNPAIQSSPQQRTYNAAPQ